MIIFAVVVCVVFFGFELYLFLNPHPDLSRARHLDQQAPFEGFLRRYDNTMTIHPYLGFVADISLQGLFNKYGFSGKEPIFTPDDNCVVIGIFGGSVAGSYCNDDSLVHFKKELMKYPSFRDKKIDVISIALGGYKQPQQLLALTYLLSIGAHFDIIINLDGFNEIALPFLENRPTRVPYYYPRNWHLITQGRYTEETIHCLDAIYTLREKMDRTREWSGGSILGKSSVFVSLSLKAKYYYYRLMKAKYGELQNILSQQSDVPERGPEEVYSSEASFFEKCASVWFNSSLQMAKICEANNIAYFHFLQPNQYVPLSKPFSEAERVIAFNEKSPPKHPVEVGYPLLQESGKRLSERGVIFSDLTMIFKNAQQPIYYDSWCHFNADGYKLISEYISKIIVDNYK
jgi:hypothetical protein